MNAIKNLLAAAALVSATLTAAQVPVSGSVQCTQPGKPNLQFKAQSAVGYFVKKSGSFEMSFFADKLTEAEMRYFVSSEADAREGKFEGKEHREDAALEERMRDIKLRAVRLWGELKENSRHGADKGPELHTAKDFSSVQLSTCSNVGGFSAGLNEEKIATIFQTFNMPTPTAAAPVQPGQVAMQWSNAMGDFKANISLKGTVPVYIVHE